MLHLENFVHTLEAQAPFVIEEIGNMSLSETGLRGQAQASQLALSDALPQGFAKIILESFEFHVQSLPVVYSIMLLLAPHEHL